jgi:pimeloyl-ACP methyl ester carboxylesterase
MIIMQKFGPRRLQQWAGPWIQRRLEPRVLQRLENLKSLMEAEPSELDSWSVMDRLGEIIVPMLVMVGREDLVVRAGVPQELAAGIPGSQLVIIEGAGNNPQDEQTGRSSVSCGRSGREGSVCLTWLASSVPCDTDR